MFFYLWIHNLFKDAKEILGNCGILWHKVVTFCFFITYCCSKTTLLWHHFAFSCILGKGEAKTDLCLFCKHDCPPLIININGKFVISKRVINVLGVTFDSKLQWSDQVANASKKAIKAINAIKLIKRYFTKFISFQEPVQILSTNF